MNTRAPKNVRENGLVDSRNGETISKWRYKQLKRLNIKASFNAHISSAQPRVHANYVMGPTYTVW